jgi:hypothetical protein
MIILIPFNEERELQKIVQLPYYTNSDYYHYFHVQFSEVKEFCQIFYMSLKLKQLHDGNIKYQ